MATVYLETTLPSYLVGKPSPILETAAKQLITKTWWESSLKHHDIFISEVVIAEIQEGNPDMAQKRLEAVRDFPILPLTDEAVNLAQIYMERIPLPPKAQKDALHIAIAVASSMDYLLTWNCRHIANGEVIRRLQFINRTIKYPTPTIVTPDELMQPSEEDTN